jgi:hypothetical protein
VPSTMGMWLFGCKLMLPFYSIVVCLNGWAQFDIDMIVHNGRWDDFAISFSLFSWFHWYY